MVIKTGSKIGFCSFQYKQEKCLERSLHIPQASAGIFSPVTEEVQSISLTLLHNYTVCLGVRRVGLLVITVLCSFHEG